MGYGGLRVLVVTVFLRRYGVNPWAFGAVEISSSAVYGIASGRLVSSLKARDRQSSMRWGPPCLVGFAAPDVLVLTTARRVSPSLYVVFACLLASAIVVAAHTIIKRSRSTAGLPPHES